MRIALAQIDPILGDFRKNSEKIIDYIQRARSKHAHVVVFSEMSLFGYPAYDLLERSDIVEEQISFIGKILKKVPAGITAIFGAVVSNPGAKKKGGKPYWNAAIVGRKGSKPGIFPKQLLPSYDVFDDTRFFEPGVKTGIVKIPGVGRTAVTVCEDMWACLERSGQKIYNRDPLKGLKKLDLVINISASPFAREKNQRRLNTVRKHVAKIKAPFVFVNQVGGQDELIFDGRSFLLDEKGKVVVQAPLCEEDLIIVDMKKGVSEFRPTEVNEAEVLRRALVLGIRDFVQKTGQSRVHLGLSGGIDSALVACLAVDALGPNRVKGLLLPGPYSSKGSIDDSLLLAKNLRIETAEIPISELYARMLHQMEPFLTSESEGVVDLVRQNIQARLRGLTMMSYSNSRQSLLLSTSNKSELASGYATLYGDLCGGLMPIGDLVKGDVYELARHYNDGRRIIPEAIFQKPPSAELAPNQVDQDTLPPYDQLDKAVRQIVEQQKSPSSADEKWLCRQLDKNEFKRWQAPPVLRVSERAFGKGRRYPISRPWFS